jgi:hypothetical protein
MYHPHMAYCSVAKPHIPDLFKEYVDHKKIIRPTAILVSNHDLIIEYKRSH